MEILTHQDYKVISPRNETIQFCVKANYIKQVVEGVELFKYHSFHSMDIVEIENEIQDSKIEEEQRNRNVWNHYKKQFPDWEDQLKFNCHFNSFIDNEGKLWLSDIKSYLEGQQKEWGKVVLKNNSKFENGDRIVFIDDNGSMIHSCKYENEKFYHKYGPSELSVNESLEDKDGNTIKYPETVKYEVWRIIKSNTDMEKLEEHMLEGVRKAYVQTQFFAFDWNVLLNNLREYHITIEVARSIKEMIENNDGPILKVVLEADTKLVESNCIEANRIEGKDIFSMYIPDKKIEGKVSRNGFVDIVVFKEAKVSKLETKYAIEIKSINTSWPGIKSDFKRLSELITKTDTTENYKNTIDSCYQLFVKQTNGYTITQNPEMLKNWKSDTKLNIENRFKNWAIEYAKDVDITVIDQEITSCSQDQIPAELDCDFHDMLERTGVAMAYCVKITIK